MRLRVFYAICLLTCLAAVPLLAQQKAADPVTGMWAGDWGPTATHRNPVTVELKWDGKMLAGTVNPGPEAVKLQKTSFDAKTGAVHLEADVDNHGKIVHFVVDGKVEGATMSGSWLHDNRKGDFKIAKK